MKRSRITLMFLEKAKRIKAKRRKKLNYYKIY